MFKRHITRTAVKKYPHGHVKAHVSQEVAEQTAQLQASVERFHELCHSFLIKRGWKQQEPIKTAKINAFGTLRTLAYPRSNARAHRRSIRPHTTSAAKSTDSGDPDSSDPPRPSHFSISCTTHNRIVPFLPWLASAVTLWRGGKRHDPSHPPEDNCREPTRIRNDKRKRVTTHAD